MTRITATKERIEEEDISRIAEARREIRAEKGIENNQPGLHTITTARQVAAKVEITDKDH